MANMSFNAIRENKVLLKISEFTVYGISVPEKQAVKTMMRCHVMLHLIGV